MRELYADAGTVRLLYADDRVAVCIKPQGVLSTDEPGGMPERLRELLGGPDTIIKTVHRLDWVTGGVMVYARTRRAAADLESQMKNGLFRKTYLAVLHGRPIQERGEWTDYIKRDERERKSFIVQPGDELSQRASLSYEIVDADKDLSLVQIELHTGRTHQIRCQFAAHGFPLAGDAKYGRGEENIPLALWARKLSFRHPRDGRDMTFSAPPPAEGAWSMFFDTIKRM